MNVAMDGVDPRQLQRDHAVEQAAAAGAAVADTGQAGDAEAGEPRNEVVRELLACPVLVDHWRDRALHEVAHLHDQLVAVGIEQLLERVEVGVNGLLHVRASFGLLARSAPMTRSAPMARSASMD